MPEKRVTKIELSEIIKKLDGVVRSDFRWPDIPAGWQIEFIAYSNNDVVMDLLHPVSARFWSEDNEAFSPPIMINGELITATALKKADVPFMTTFSTAKVVESERSELHLKVVSDNNLI